MKINAMDWFTSSPCLEIVEAMKGHNITDFKTLLYRDSKKLINAFQGLTAVYGEMHIPVYITYKKVGGLLFNKITESSYTKKLRIAENNYYNATYTDNVIVFNPDMGNKYATVHEAVEDILKIYKELTEGEEKPEEEPVWVDSIGNTLKEDDEVYVSDISEQHAVGLKNRLTFYSWNYNGFLCNSDSGLKTQWKYAVKVDCAEEEKKKHITDYWVESRNPFTCKVMQLFAFRNNAKWSGSRNCVIDEYSNIGFSINGMLLSCNYRDDHEDSTKVGVHEWMRQVAIHAGADYVPEPHLDIIFTEGDMQYIIRPNNSIKAIQVSPEGTGLTIADPYEAYYNTFIKGIAQGKEPEVQALRDKYGKKTITKKKDRRNAIISKIKVDKDVSVVVKSKSKERKAQIHIEKEVRI